jgi:hypothetical protein
MTYRAYSHQNDSRSGGINRSTSSNNLGKVRAKLDKEMQKTMTELRAKFSQADWGWVDDVDGTGYSGTPLGGIVAL